ncbi:MAG: histidinol-phosphate transaminase [Eubacteriales bacterium]
MDKYLSDLARSIVPYTAGEQPKNNVIKLNTNENPYPPSQHAIAAAANAIKPALRRYPKTDGGDFRDAAALVNKVDAKNVFCSNGSDELLAFCFAAFFDPDKPVKIFDVTYSFYPVWAKFFNIPLDIIPLNSDFSVPVKEMYMSKGGVVFPNPNAPTGMAISLNEVEKIVANNEGKVVIVDEAYVAFGCETAVPLTKKYDNLLVVRTLSKSHSLAGLRAGYAIGSEYLINGLTRIRDSFNSYPTDAISQEMAAAALKDETYANMVYQNILETRKETILALKKLKFNVLPSLANFVFISHEIPAKTLLNELKKAGILVRYFNLPRIDNYLRVTIGTGAEMIAFISKLEKILSSLGYVVD